MRLVRPLFVLPLTFGLACSGSDKDDEPVPGSDSGHSEDTGSIEDTGHSDDSGDTGGEPVSEDEQQAIDAYDAFIADLP